MIISFGYWWAYSTPFENLKWICLRFPDEKIVAISVTYVENRLTFCEKIDKQPQLQMKRVTNVSGTLSCSYYTRIWYQAVWHCFLITVIKIYIGPTYRTLSATHDDTRVIKWKRPSEIHEGNKWTVEDFKDRSFVLVRHPLSQSGVTYIAKVFWKRSRKS